MRHIRSILYALVLAPAAWVLTGVGLNSDLTTRGRDGFAVENVTGLLMLLLAGAAYGILVLGPISPAGPAAAGVVYLGMTTWALISPSAYADIWPPSVSQEGFDLSRPGFGLAALLAVPLIGTALSARRWEKYEPPVLPIIGQVGRFRGAAPVPGTPIAAAPTTVITAGTDPEPTTVLHLPGPASDHTTIVVTSGNDAPTVDVSESEAGEPTAVVSDPAADEETTAVVKAAGDDPTAEDDEPTVAGGDEPTAAVTSVGADEEPTVSVGADEEPTVSVGADEEPTVSVGAGAGQAADDEAIGDVDASGADDEPTEVAVAAGESEEPSAADRDSAIQMVTGEVTADADGSAAGAEPAKADTTASEDDVPTVVAAAEDEVASGVENADAEPGGAVAAAGEQPAVGHGGEGVEAALPGAADADGEGEARADFGNAGEGDGDESEGAGSGSGRVEEAGDEPEPGDRTQVIRLPVGDDSERTQVVRLPVGDDSERTQVVRLPVADDGDRTQVIRLPVGDGGERGQVVRLPVAEDGEKTQVVRLPAGEGERKLLPFPVSDPGERTRVIEPQEQDSVEKTQVLRFPSRPIGEWPTRDIRGVGEWTRDLSNRATGDVGGDETQVIRLVEKTVDDERTQAIRPQLVTPPGERTEVVTLPVAGGSQLVTPPGERTEVVTLPVAGGPKGEPAVSIADAEAPNFAEDPTGRITPPAERDDREDGPRPKTVLDMERAPDEVSEDTTYIPAPRRPAEDES